jgi:hypothetical protein
MPVATSDRGWVQEAAGLQRPQYLFAPTHDPHTDPPPAAAEVPYWKWDAYQPSDLQACTASAIAAAVELVQNRPPPGRFQPSIGFIYYVARYLRLNETRDSGASIYDGLRGSFYFGFCAESDWPIQKVRATTRPPAAIQTAAEAYGIAEFRHLDRSVYGRPAEFLLYCKEAIREGHAIIFGALVDDAFLDGRFANHGLDIRLPAGLPTHKHCLLAVRYEDSASSGDGGFFWVRDSLGPQRGAGGYLRLPYAYVTRGSLSRGDFLSNDFWIVTRASTSGALDAQLAANRTAHWQKAAALAGRMASAYDQQVAALRGEAAVEPRGRRPDRFPPPLS